MMRDAELAATLGLRGTPAFLIGTVGPTGELEVADVIAGAQQIEEFETVLDKLIEKAS